MDLYIVLKKQQIPIVFAKRFVHSIDDFGISPVSRLYNESIGLCERLPSSGFYIDVSIWGEIGRFGAKNSALLSVSRFFFIYFLAPLGV